MKTIIMFIIIVNLFLSYTVFAKDNTKNKYNTENIIGVFAVISADSKSIDYIEARDQICFENKNFPIIPFVEADINIGLTNKNPKSFFTVFFGMKKNILERHNLIFSVNMGSGLAVGIFGNDNAGIIGKIGFDIAYKNIVLRLSEINLISGFPFKGTTSFGLSYVL